MQKLGSMLSPEAEPLDVLWQDPITDPRENLTRLSQIAGAYAPTTIDKASEVQLLLKDKEDKILFLQKQLQRASVSREEKEKLVKLQQDFQQMQLGYQSSLAEKEQHLHATLEMHKDDPKFIEFLTEALALNDQLLQLQETICQRISLWNSHYEMSDNVTSQVIDLLLDYDLIYKKVSHYLNWQESEEGKKEGLPKINESHKEMLFNKWDA